MNFFDQFQVTDKALGKVRSKYIKQIEKDLGQFLEYQSAFIPTVSEDEKRTGVSRLVGKSKIEKLKERYLLFNALVNEHSFKNLIGFLSPIPLGTGFIVFEEYTYTTLLPYPCDSTIIYIEKKGLFKGQKGFFAIQRAIDQIEIDEESLLQSSGEDSLAFKLSQILQALRNDRETRNYVEQAIKSERQQSALSNHLNNMSQLHKEIKGFTALSEAKKKNVKVSDALGITIILLPMKSRTLVQVGDFKLNPTRAMKVLNLLAVGLHEASQRY